MKKVIGLFGMVLIFASCHSDNDMKYKEDESGEKKVIKSENTAGGIDNVNGGIPDTTNTIGIGTQKKDTLMVSSDSTK
ncbi:MAG: hypothetical protein ABI683_14590 [Ginsengibacter sp.]